MLCLVRTYQGLSVLGVALGTEQHVPRARGGRSQVQHEALRLRERLHEPHLRVVSL